MRSRAMRKVVLRYHWDRMKVSFWFAPLIMSLGALLLVRVMNWIDLQIMDEVFRSSKIILSGGAAEHRTMLINLATTILTVASIVFTLLTLPLSTVAAQYGSRLLRLFLGDRIAQVVLGLFVAGFVYCIAAATSIIAVTPTSAIPVEGYQLTSTMGIVFMFAAFTGLILLIQHISTMLQAPQIAAAAGTELMDLLQSDAIQKLNDQAEQGQMSQSLPETLVASEGYPIRLGEAGYIQFIDPEYLVTLLQENNKVTRLCRKPGSYVSPGEVVALVWPGDTIDARLDKQIQDAFQVGKQRTPTQDLVYAINQLVEMAVRAMSPAINDPFTAMTCLDHIGDGVAHFTREVKGTPYFYDRNGQLRVIFEPVHFDELLSAAFDMLRHASCDNASVLLHMLDVIDVIARETKSPDRLQKLLCHVSLIQAESRAGELIDQDCQLIQQKSETLLKKWEPMN